MRSQPRKFKSHQPTPGVPGVPSFKQFLLERLETSKKTLLEGVSDILYHYTHLGNLMNILEGDRFVLSTDVGTGADRDFNKSKGKFYYFSTTRHKLGGYHKDPGGESRVMLVLDGRSLGNRLSGAPVDYWGPEFAKLDRTKQEAEDRLWSEKPYIEKASKYIKEIHIMQFEEFTKQYDLFLPRDQWKTKQNVWSPFMGDLQRYRKVLFITKKKNIPCYIYRDHKNWLLQNKRKSVHLDIASLKSDPVSGYSRVGRNHFEEYIELYHKKKERDLSKKAEKLLYDLKYHDYGNERAKMLNNDIHNNKSKPESGLKSLLDIMKKERLRTPQDYIDMLKERWKIT